MAKALRTVGVILGAAALIATGIGAVAVAGAGIAGIGSFTAIGAVTGLAAGIANLGAVALTNRPKALTGASPGTITQVLLAADAARPYPMGAGHFAGVMRHREGYGGTVDGVPNPYWLEVVVYSGTGPVHSITPQIQFDDVPAWYNGYLTTDTQLGEVPESSALSASFGTPARWTSAHKLSGHPAIAWNYKFDKNGKVFASGFPQTGAYGEWNLVYDPRQDSTFPGGSGSCRFDDESTWVWDGLPGDAIPAGENPALHAGTYARGRFVETDAGPVRVMGMGLPVESIDFARVAAWASTCAENEWRIFGVVWEGGDADDRVRWQNLKDIAAAGGGEPAFAGAVLSFLYSAPTVAIDTVTEADVLGAASVTFMQSYRDVLKTAIPQFTSPEHNWELIKADPVTLPDVEGRTGTVPLPLVKDKDQATQLAAYRALDSREFHPIAFRAMPRLRNYRPGDCLDLELLGRLGVDGPAILLHRGPLDPQTMTRDLVFRGETAAKHEYALGRTGTVPPPPQLGQSAQERDETAFGAAAKVQVDVVRVRDYAADASGTVTGVLPDYIVPVVTLGGEDVRTSDAVSYAIDPVGVTATVNDTPSDPDKGIIEITEVTALNGWIDFTVTVGGVAQPTIRIATRKTTGLPTGLGGSGAKVASDSSFPNLSATTYADLTDVMTVTVGTGEKLVASAPLDYGPVTTSPVSRTVTAKWQYSAAGAGTWSDFDTGEIAGSVSVGGFNYVAGHGDFNDEASPGSGDWDVKLVGKLDASGVPVALSGTASIEVKV